LSPYLNPLENGAKSIIYKKGIIGKKLAVRLAKSLKISRILNLLIGVDVFKDSSRYKGLLEELIDSLWVEKEESEKLEELVAKTVKKIVKAGNYRNGISTSTFTSINVDPLFGDAKPGNNQVILVEGVLNRIDRVGEYYHGISEVLSGEKINWILSDRPFYMMEDSFIDYDHAIVPIGTTTGLDEILDNSPIFKKETGWYPYCRILGTYRNSLSRNTPTVPLLDLGFLFWRQPPQIGLLPIDTVKHRLRTKEEEHVDRFRSSPDEKLIDEFLADLSLVYIVFRANKIETVENAELQSVVVEYCNHIISKIDAMKKKGVEIRAVNYIREIQDYFETL
jgi:hypothetical protein